MVSKYPDRRPCKPYNPLDAKEPDVTASAEDRAIGGLGIFMVRKMMDKVEYLYILSLITALLFRQILPDEAVQWMSTNLLSPVESLFISALMCMTAPAVFVSITCSMFRFEGFSELGRSGKTVVAT